MAFIITQDSEGFFWFIRSSNGEIIAQATRRYKRYGYCERICLSLKESFIKGNVKILKDF